MESRKLRKVKQEAHPEPFEEEVVKYESDDNYYTIECLEDNTESVKKNIRSSKKSTTKQKSKIGPHSRSRATQVTSEEIDANLIHMSEVAEKLDEEEPLNHAASEQSSTHCRFCLRQVASENLKPIASAHKTKALATFRIRIYPSDPFQLACLNCLNLLDIFVKFKEAIVKSKKLLARRVGFMESDGWDETDTVQSFEKCKQVVADHRKQIFTMYDKYIKLPEESSGELNEPNTEAKCEVKVEPEELSNSYCVEDVAQCDVADSTFEQEPAEIITSLLIEHIAPDDQRALQNATVIWTGSDDEDVPDAMDVENDDYVPDEVEVKQEQVPKRGRKPRKGGKSKANDKNSYNQKLCDICGESICPTAEESHVNQHLGVKPYACPQEGCDLTFHSRYNQAKHVKRAHKGAETHECDTCGKIIRGPLWALKQHQRRHNLTEKSYVCTICGKGFTMSWYLTQHSAVHSSEMPHKCSYCGKRFNNKWSMRTHERNIHEKRMNVSGEVENHDVQNVSYEPAFEMIQNVE